VWLVQRQVGRPWQVTPRVLTEALAAGGAHGSRIRPSEIIDRRTPVPGNLGSI
jgi:hypothetical protein